MYPVIRMIKALAKGRQRQIDILDTYVYRLGLRTGEYSLATAAGLFKAVLGMAMIVGAHLVSKRLTGKGVW